MEEMSIKELSTGVLSKSEGSSQRGGQLRLEEERLKDVCADFESIFVSYMMKALRRTIPESGLTKLPGNDMYVMMFDQKVAEDLSSKGGGIGLQKILLRQLGGSYKSGGED